MRLHRGHVTCLLLLAGLACAVPQVLARKKDKAIDSRLSEQKRAVHALNRLAFGPRNGDVQQVMAMGVDKWIDLQLHPEKIKDGAIEARLAPFRTLRMGSHEIAESFPDGQMVKQVLDGKRPMPSDPAKRAIYEVQIARQQEKKERKEEKGAAGAAPVHAPSTVPAMNSAGMERSGSATEGESTTSAVPMADGAAASGVEMKSSVGGAPPGASSSSPSASGPSSSGPSTADAMANNDQQARLREERLYADLKVQQLIDLPPDERYKKVISMSPEEQLAFADSMRGGKGQEFLTGLDPRQKETLQAMNNPQGVVDDELIQAKLLRAIYSERQLEEVMTDFWFNHFNVFVGKGPDRLMLTSYEQNVLRPHAMGKFEDLLVATAKSPAMLFYLDNWLSVGPDSMQAHGIPAHPQRASRSAPRPRNGKRKANAGLNENYGRELLELHTLSVNGGYSQQDVTEAAKIFTGWTIDKPNEGGGFKYDPRMHEPGPKFVMGHRFKPKGEDEGRELLHLLATNPKTAHFISLKLAQRFISDDPPEALVDRMTKTFLKKKGDIREVLATLFYSPEFWEENTYRAKVKTPLEFVASAVRATGGDVQDALPLARQLGNMGMPLYGAQPPTGYSMKAETWVNSSALLNRMNFALSLVAGKIRGVKVDAAQVAGIETAPSDSTTMLVAMETTLLAGDVSKQTHDSIVNQMADQKNAAVEKPDAHNKKANQRKQNAVPRPPDTNTIAGLLLGSPEFQRR